MKLIPAATITLAVILAMSYFIFGSTLLVSSIIGVALFSVALNMKYIVGVIASVVLFGIGVILAGYHDTLFAYVFWFAGVGLFGTIVFFAYINMLMVIGEIISPYIERYSAFFARGKV